MPSLTNQMQRAVPLGMQRNTWVGRWPLYAAIWWLMFVLTELGQAFGPGYSWTEAIAGIIAEAIYCPLSAFLVARLLGAKGASA